MGLHVGRAVIVHRGVQAYPGFTRREVEPVQRELLRRYAEFCL